MIKSKAIEILRTFDKDEFKRFGKFVSSPYFNENSKLVNLYTLLKKYYPDFSSRNFNKEYLYARLFDGKKYNDGTMRKLLSGIQGLAEEFLVHSSLDSKNLFQKKLALLYKFDEKNLVRLFEINMKALNAVYKNPKGFEDDYFKSNFELLIAELNFNVGKGRGGFDSESVIDNLLKCATHLICYSLIIIFKLNQDIMVRSLGYDFDYRDNIAYKFIESIGPEKFINCMEKYTPEFYPVIAIYFNRFMIAAGFDEDDSYYRKLKELVLSHVDSFTRFEKYNLMLFLENSCDEKITSGKNFSTELHDLHKKMIALELLTSEDKDYLSLIGFRKIIRNSLAVGELKWTKDFVNKYLGMLPEAFRDNMYYYSQALIEFTGGAFNKALENVSKVKLETYAIKFDMWAMKLESEFELGYYEEALYSIDSYKHLLKKDNVSPEWMKERILIFIGYFNKVLRFKNENQRFSETDREMLKQEISAAPNLIDRKWLAGKLEKMKT